MAFNFVFLRWHFIFKDVCHGVIFFRLVYLCDGILFFMKVYSSAMSFYLSGKYISPMAFYFSGRNISALVSHLFTSDFLRKGYLCDGAFLLLFFF